MFVSDLVAGDTLSKTWQLLGPTGTPVDLTGCTASFGMVGVLNGASALQINSTDTNSALTIPTPLNGTLILAALGTATSGLVAGMYLAAIKVTFPNGQGFTYDQENIRVAKAIVQ